MTRMLLWWIAIGCTGEIEPEGTPDPESPPPPTSEETDDCGPDDPRRDGEEVPYDGVDNDCDPATPDDDLDGDGFGIAVDCDDADPDVNPGRYEEFYNGVDDDCDEASPDDDVDGDGFLLVDDCNDRNATINPGETEVVYNGRDDDCDATTPDDDLDGDGFTRAEDCDDQLGAVNPGVAEQPGNGIDDDCDPTTPPLGFSTTPATWALPAGGSDGSGEPWDWTFGSNFCNPDEASWATLDMTGDGALDLVSTEQCDTDGIGQDKWRVYPGTASGFSSTPVDFELPLRWDVFGEDAYFEGIADEEICGPGRLSSYTTFDIDGDRLPDLVEYGDCGRGELGGPYWRVYRNTGQTFDTTPIEWALPPRYASGFGNPLRDEEGLSDRGDCFAGSESGAYATFDINGDGRPDLVDMYDCGQTDLGTARWQVYLGTGTGFSATATDWTLPARWPGPNTPWVDVLDSPVCGFGADDRSRYRMYDMNGDGQPDLVETYACATGGVGFDTWTVYLGTTGGFETTPTPWPLPERSQFSSISQWSGVGDWGCGVDRWSDYHVFDLDGDGPVDLVETYACGSRGMGTEHWRIFRGSPSGFATDYLEWALPERWTEPGEPSSWRQLDRDFASCGTVGDQSAYALTDIDGNGRLDLVETYACGELDMGLGSWRVHPAELGE